MEERKIDREFKGWTIYADHSISPPLKYCGLKTHEVFDKLLEEWPEEYHKFKERMVSSSKLYEPPKPKLEAQNWEDN